MNKKYVVVSCVANCHRYPIGTVVTATIDTNNGWTTPTYVAMDEHGFSQLLEEDELQELP